MSYISAIFARSTKIKFLVLSSAVVFFTSSLHAQDDMIWNELDPENTVYLQLEEGVVVIQLNPVFAPKTVKQFKRLLEEQFYRGRSFYRVIDGFVAQAGDESDVEGESTEPMLDAEFEIDWPQKPEDKELAKEWQPMPWMQVQKDDLFAPYTGFVDGFAVARDSKKDGKGWPIHCPGVIAMARGNEPGSGSTDFYIVIGQAPRYLDRNLTVFGRVVWGMEIVQKISRGPVTGPTPGSGMIEEDLDRTWIKRMRLASSLEEEERLNILIADTNTKGYKKLLKDRRNRSHAFFHHNPPKVLDICQVPVPARLELK